MSWRRGAVVAGFILVLGGTITLGILVPAAWAGIGGIGSAVGGLAAAIAAWRSRDAAKASEASSARMEEISRDSRRALGRAMKPRFKIRLTKARGAHAIAFDVDQTWPALDPTIIIRVPGVEDSSGQWEGDLRTMTGSVHMRFPDPPDDVERYLEPPPWASDQNVLRCAVVVQVHDRERILMHQNTYVMFAEVSEPGPDGHRTYLPPFREAKLVEETDWPLEDPATGPVR